MDPLRQAWLTAAVNPGKVSQEPVAGSFRSEYMELFFGPPLPAAVMRSARPIESRARRGMRSGCLRRIGSGTIVARCRPATTGSVMMVSAPAGLACWHLCQSRIWLSAAEKWLLLQVAVPHDARGASPLDRPNCS